MLQDMATTCLTYSEDNSTLIDCGKYALAYYSALRLFGLDAFAERQLEVCECEKNTPKLQMARLLANVPLEKQQRSLAPPASTAVKPPNVQNLNSGLLQRTPNDKDAFRSNSKDAPKADLQDVPKDAPKAGPQDEPKDAPKEPPKDTAKTASASCGGKTLAGSITESDKRLNGSAVVASLDASDFGNTSKLGADFSFTACKVGNTWRFQLKDLVVPIASKVQDVTFRKNIDNAAAAEVTKGSYTDIVRDLSPTRKVTFSVSCGNKKDKDTVKTYSTREEYWKQQFVIDHEAFHRKDWVDMYKKELIKAESDVNAHSIPEGEAKDAAAAVAKANSELTKYMTDAYQRLCDAFTPGKESRAYDAGAPAYKKLVDEISARATKEKW